MSTDDNRNGLVTLAELLFVPLVFHVVTQWNAMDTSYQKGLWVLLFLLVQNEYLSVTKSYKYYNMWLYFLDLCSLSVYVLALERLQNDGDWLQYDHSFWFVLSFLWLFYAAWDFVMLKASPEYEDRESLFKWGVWMMVLFVVSLSISIYLEFLVENKLDQMRFYGPAVYYHVVDFTQLCLACFSLFALSLWINDLRISFAKGKTNPDV